MKVRYSYLPQQFEEAEDLWKNLKAFVKTGDFTLGEPLKEFEKKFADYQNTNFATLFNSGGSANIIRKIIHKLKAALKLLGLIFLLRLSKILIPENSILIK